MKSNPQVYATQDGVKEIKNNSQVNNTQEGIEQIKNNPEVYTTQKGIREIKSNPQVYTTKAGIEGAYQYFSGSQLNPVTIESSADLSKTSASMMRSRQVIPMQDLFCFRAWNSSIDEVF